MPKRVDITGKKYGHLTVVGLTVAQRLRWRQATGDRPVKSALLLAALLAWGAVEFIHHPLGIPPL